MFPIVEIEDEYYFLSEHSWGKHYNASEMQTYHSEGPGRNVSRTPRCCPAQGSPRVEEVPRVREYVAVAGAEEGTRAQ